MFANVKLPHAVLVALSAAAVLITWATAQESSGAINLPAWGVTLLSLAATLIGLFSPSAAPSAAPAAMAAKRGFASVRALAMVAVLGLATLVCGAACTKQQAQQVVTDVSTAIDLTNAVCAIAPDSPVGQPYVDLVCQVAQGVEQVVDVVVGTLADQDGGAAATAAPATMRVPIEQIRLKMLTTAAPAFLASHKGH